MNDKKKVAETPLMKQFFEIKSNYPDSLLLYRVGDFYETFGEDAIITSKVLGIVLTRKATGSGTYTELAGVPHHAIDTYLPKLVKAGYKVAVCDQLEDPKLTKKIVKRGVTELVTPGVAYNDNLLRQDENNFLAAVYFNKDTRTGNTSDKAGIAFLDISTGTFKIAQGSMEYIEVLLSNMSPKEILIEKGYQDGFRKRFGNIAYISTLDEWAFVYESCRKKLCTHFGLESLKGFGVEQLPLGISASGAVLFYLEMTQHSSLGHIRAISRIDEGDFVWMDRFTFRNLEIFNSFGGNEGRSLLSVIDRCSSPMGARLLKEWLSMPLKDISKIEHRYDVVSAFVADGELREKVQTAIGNIGDLERIVSKAAAGKIAPREVLQLGRGLKNVAEIKQLLSGSGGSSADDVFSEFISSLDGCTALNETITCSILQECASQIGKGDVIATGVNEDLDKLRNTLNHGKDILLQIQQQEKERTGISSLKISYNNVFGYYLEVRNTHSDKVPSDWIRKQTLVNAERYITPELKEYEEQILGAEGRILELETQLYTELVAEIRNNIQVIQRNATTIASLDCLVGFAQLAVTNHYCRPEMNDSLEIGITGGRHPVIETMMNPGEEYIANDLYLSNNSQQIIILTGPNMAGKSAFLRQSALIVLLAQIGCFVPAQRAQIGFIDKLFTRVGASDNISKGESTFMVEMLETATILHNVSQRSLILLDEIGRGTSTYDGMSIAWSIVEYLHEGEDNRFNPCPKTLFATHYHELNDLESLYERVHNYHISVKEVDGKVIFLRKLCEGGVAHSFGIHVAKLAGMPETVVRQAEKKLKSLEGSKGNEAKSAKKAESKPIQLSLYQLDDPLLLDIKDELKRIDINKMSPLEAFDTIRELKRKIGL
ncbi:MAG: DNA mismatch repair protein MutS [Bacteroidales bacterium]|nr:DNA mismatch repair protein MutS [Bacteroidales bacterium]MDD4670602.1 DNA mismatch repair protein MutS [Bacteroidales bacterium]